MKNKRAWYPPLNQTESPDYTGKHRTRDRVQPSVERFAVTLDVAAALAEYGRSSST